MDLGNLNAFIIDLNGFYRTFNFVYKVLFSPKHPQNDDERPTRLIISASFSCEPSQPPAHFPDPTRSILLSSSRLTYAHPLSHTLYPGGFSNLTSCSLARLFAFVLLR